MDSRAKEGIAPVNPPTSPERRPWRLRRWPWPILLAAAVAAGCDKSPVEITAARPAPAEASGSLQPAEVLQRMLAAYQQASAYRDEGVVVLQYRLGGQTFRDEAPLAVTLMRPNKLAVRAYQASLACDGQQLRAAVTDPASRNMDGQFVQRPAPPTMTLPALYQDAVLHGVISSGLGRHPVQLELLLGDQPLQEFIADDTPKSLLQEVVVEKRPCWLVEVRTSEGPFQLAIDKQDYLLRRMEYPTESLVAAIMPTAAVSDVRLAAEFRGARANVGVDDDPFGLVPPPNAKLVRYFVLPPQPLPSDLFGKPLDDFFFVDLKGQRVTRDQLRGKIVVLAWIVEDENCLASLQELEQVRRQNSDDSPVAFFAVCTQPSSVSDQQLRELMDDWQVSMPAVRDLQSFGRDVFRIPGAPTLVVLDARSVVQIVEAGFNPKLAAELPHVLQRLQAGDDLAEEILQQYRREQADYASQLELAQATEQEAAPQASETQIASPSEPRRLKLTRLWGTQELQAPGNILVRPEGQDNVILTVLDGWRTAVELSGEGEVLSRRELDLPEKASISYLRQAWNGQGQRWLAAAHIGSQQVHVLDDAGQRRFSYPDQGQAHDGIRDVQLVDLDGDGDLELYVGFAGIVGVHCVDMQGERIWGNRSVSDVLTLAPRPASDRQEASLLVTSEQGSLVRMNSLGQHESPASGRATFYLFPARFAEGQVSTYCGFTYSPRRRLTALGLNDPLRELWSYELPPGTFQTPIQFVVSGDVIDGLGGQWFIAAPDGTLHVISDDGKFSDYFGWGQPLTGLGVGRIGRQGVLFTSSASGLMAWRAELRETP